ncbi:MAG: AMP-dependent synthetase, partial [Deltaproteobacteria bacterium HGW-Deltaproteobacteria-17]
MSDIYSEKPWQKSYDEHVRPSLEYEDKTFAQKFKETAQRYADKTALIYLGKRLSFKDIDRLSDRLAAYFIQNGLKPDDVVGLHLPNIPANYISVVAVQKAGAVSTGLSPLLTPQEMEHQLRDAKVKMVVTVDVLFEKIKEVAPQADFSHVLVAEIADYLPKVKAVLGKMLKKIPVGTCEPLPGKTVIRFPAALAGMPDEPVMVPRTMDDTIFLMYTGGTTGPAKGAV